MRAKAFLLVLLLLLSASLAAAATLSVAGQASGPGGAALKDARALLVRLPAESEAARLELEGKAGPEPAASVPVGADGTFRLEAPEAGMWKVVVQATGHAPQEYALLPLIEPVELPAVRLEKDQRLEVRVTGPDGRPLAGARVRTEVPEPAFSRSTGWKSPVRAGLTDAQGGIVFPRGANEGLLVRAGAPGLPLAERKDVRSSSVALKLAAGPTRDLRVLDAAGKPVAGARIGLGEPRWIVGTTSQDGLLAVPLGGRQKTAVSVATEDGRSAKGYLEPLRTGETGPRELRLDPLQALAGRVVSAADGRPVPGALVWTDDPGAFRRAGSDGAYRLDAVPGRELRLQGAAPGFFRTAESWPVQAGERRAPTLALEPAQTVAGTVVDEQGRPVAGVEIKAELQPGSRPRTMAGWGSGGTAFTNAAGAFRLSTLVAGMGHELRLTRRGYAPATEAVPPIEPGRAASSLRLVLRKGRTGIGRVVDPADQPVAGAR